MKAAKGAFLILTLLLTGLTYINPASASRDDVRKELEAVYAKIDAAITGKDLKTLESLLGEDYEKQRGDETIKRAEAVAEMKKSLEMVKEFKSSKTVINKIQHVEGNEIVDYTQTIKATVTGADGKDQPFEVTSKGRDWWVKEDDGKWICVSSERVE